MRCQMVPYWTKLAILLNFCHVYTSFNLFGNGGSWCPYQVDKYVSCQVRNGTETYYGSPICWKAVNGSFSCTKRVLYRPKFVKTYKKVKETKYKCCPAYYGSDCNLECFNCSTFQALEAKVNRIESQMGSFVRDGQGQRTTQPDQNQVSAPLPNEIVDTDAEDNNKDHEQLENAIAGVIANVRTIDIRVRALEHKLGRMMETVQQVAMTNLGLKSIIDSLSRKNEAQQAPTPQALPAAAENYYKVPHEDERHRQHIEDPSPTTSAETIASQLTAFRILEQNLARGDIASTLNDDYGEEIVPSSVSPDEEYLDPFHLNDEGNKDAEDIDVVVEDGEHDNKI